MIFVFLEIIGVFTLTFYAISFDIKIKPPRQNKFGEEVLFYSLASLFTPIYR